MALSSLRTGPPRWPFYLNTDHSVGKDITFLWHPTGRHGVLTDHGPHKVNATYGAGGAQHLFGPARTLVSDFASNNYAQLPVSSSVYFNGLSEYTFFSWVEQKSASFGNILSCSSNFGIWIGRNGTTSNLQFRSIFAADQTLNTTEGRWAANALRHIVCRAKAGTKTIWIDGVASSATQAYTGTSTISLIQPNCLGAYYNGASNFLLGKMWMSGFVPRGLTDGEIRALYSPQSRWDLLQEVGKRTYFFAPAGAAFDPSTGFPWPGALPPTMPPPQVVNN